MTIQLYRPWVYSKEDKDIGFPQMNIWSLWKIATDHTGKLRKRSTCIPPGESFTSNKNGKGGTRMSHIQSTLHEYKHTENIAESGELRCST